ncbi:MAG: hypothetical protein KDJ31_03420 [Candidatus Competibacteraceae bacterium]|nr:hypothetical protein [Candidatus Competibacteraceae bacterium]
MHTQSLVFGLPNIPCETTGEQTGQVRELGYGKGPRTRMDTAVAKTGVPGRQQFARKRDQFRITAVSKSKKIEEKMKMRIPVHHYFNEFQVSVWGII